MSRATYIYVVIRKAHAVGYEWAEDDIYAICTVKQEAFELVPILDREDYKLVRFRDGTTHAGEEIRWDEE
jgi:hypothetical protein